MRYVSMYPLLNQGAGGNFSFKSKDYLYVKSSGLSFNKASTRCFFSKIKLKKLQEIRARSFYIKKLR